MRHTDTVRLTILRKLRRAQTALTLARLHGPSWKADELEYVIRELRSELTWA